MVDPVVVPSREKETEAMLLAVHQIVLAANLCRDLDPEKQERQRLKDQKWQNRAQHLRILFGIFEWRYILLPVGIKKVVHFYAFDREHLCVYAWHVHVFGIRLFRWVYDTEVYQEDVPLTKVPRQRYRKKRCKKV